MWIEEGAIAPVPSFSGEIADFPTRAGLSDDDKREGILKMRLLGQRPRYQEGPPEGAGYVA